MTTNNIFQLNHCCSLPVAGATIIVVHKTNHILAASQKFGINTPIVFTLLDGCTEVDDDVYDMMPGHGPENPYIIKALSFTSALANSTL